MSDRCLEVLVGNTMLGYCLCMQYMVRMRTSKVHMVHMGDWPMYMRHRITNLIVR
jgi:hypothetical protein